MRKSIALLISSIYVVFYLIGNGLELYRFISSEDPISQFAGYATGLLVTPHFLLVVLGLIFGVLAYVQNRKTFALVSAILYSCALVLYFMAFLQMLLPVVLSFVGYGTMHESNFRPRKRIATYYDDDLDKRSYKESLEYLRKSPSSKQRVVRPVENIVFNKTLPDIFKGVQYLVGFIIIISSFGLEASANFKVLGIVLGMSVFPLVFDMIADYMRKHRMDLLKYEVMYFFFVLILVFNLF